jgi:cell division transport system permease protein
MDNFWLNLRRVSRAGFVNFWRSGLISFTSVFVMTVTLFMVGSLIVMSAFLQSSLSELENKVDINVYFTTQAGEEEVLDLKKRIEFLTEVKSVEYVSREKALTDFLERNKDNSLVIQSIEELEDNPLGAVLNIRATDTSGYERIAAFLDEQASVIISSDGVGIIDSINYFQNRLVIDRLGKIIDGARTMGLVVSVTLMLMAVLVTFNTIRLAIYNSREEIEVMRLVGAGKSYIRGPFVIEGLMYGFVAAILAIILLYPATLWVGGATTGFFGGIDLAAYYQANFFLILLLLLVFGLLLGTVSSFIAVRRYLDR